MSNGPIALLTEEDLAFVPEPPEFEQLAVEELGLHASDADGFDAQLNEAVLAMGDFSADAALMDADLEEAAAEHPALAEDDATPLIEEIAPAVTDGDALLETYDHDLTGNVSGTPTTPTTPATPTAAPPVRAGCTLQEWEAGICQPPFSVEPPERPIEAPWLF